MMESSRGPGFIGTLLALVVLAIFVLFYLFAFDEGMQGGGRNIQSVIAEQERDIGRLREDTRLRGKELERLPKLNENQKALSSAMRENRDLETQINGLKDSVASTSSDISLKAKEFETYKDDYRAFVRGKAKGEIMEKLETTKGTYDNVTIREVTAIGMQIRHEGGLKRVPYEELPAKMQDYYQFDPTQKAAAIANEDSVRNQHDTAVAIAENIAAEGAAMQKDNATIENREIAERNILKMEAQVQSLQDEITRLNSDLSRASMEASSARAAGRIHLDKSGEIRRNITAKQNRISSLRTEISRSRR